MLPYSRHVPKPLLKIGNKTLLDSVLDKLGETDLQKVVINSFHLSRQLVRHIKKRDDGNTDVIVEKKLLGTGGGVKNALAHLSPGPFLVLNSDIIWMDQKDNCFARLADYWDGKKMDALLLLYPTNSDSAKNLGDYRKDRSGRIYRRKDFKSSPYIFTGIQILHARLFKESPKDPFSLVSLYDRAEEFGRLFGLVYNGLWHDVGTKDKLDNMRKKIKAL